MAWSARVNGHRGGIAGPFFELVVFVLHQTEADPDLGEDKTHPDQHHHQPQDKYRHRSAAPDAGPDHLDADHQRRDDHADHREHEEDQGAADHTGQPQHAAGLLLEFGAHGLKQRTLVGRTVLELAVGREVFAVKLPHPANDRGVPGELRQAQQTAGRDNHHRRNKLLNGRVHEKCLRADESAIEQDTRLKIGVVVEFVVDRFAVFPTGHLDLVRVKFTSVFHIDRELVLCKRDAIAPTIVFADTY